MPLRSEAAEILADYQGVRDTYVGFAAMLRQLLEALLRPTDVGLESVRSRAKEVDSLRGKLERHPEYTALLQLPDLCGARVVVHSLDDVERASQLVRSEFEVHAEERRGAEQAEAFGYASWHFLVSLRPPRSELPENVQYAGLRSEIQVRTVLQHGWALISHRLDYKTESEVPKEVRRRLFRVAALLETSDELFADFGRAVDDIRATYARVVDEIREAPVEVVEERRGAELPLDIDSLRAAWDTLPLDVIDEAADLAEFSEWQTPSEELVRSGLSLVLEEAEAAGLRSIGDLERAIQRLPEHAPAMKRFAELMVEREKHRPVAVRPFVLSVGLGLESDAALDVFAQSIYAWMGDALRDAKAG